MLYADHMAVIA